MNVYTYSQYSNSDTSGNGSKEFPYNRFEDAMANVEDGGTIYIINKAFLNVQNNNETFVIDKDVTIRPAPGHSNAYFQVRSSGIALGADVTIEDITLGLENRTRAAIFANGHKLTLSNITRGAGNRKIHLYGGGASGLENYAGDNGSIIIKGKCELGNIFGGGLEISSGDAYIQMDKGTSTKYMKIYASGSNVAEFNPDNILDPSEIPDPKANPAYTSGDVTIELTNGQIMKNIDGKGADSVQVIVSGAENLASMSLTDITGFELSDGKVELTSLTAKDGGNIDFNLKSGAVLILTQLGKVPTIGKLDGSGGMVAVKQNETLAADGFTGHVKIATEDWRNFNGQSGLFKEGHTYLTVKDPNADGTLELVPNDNQPDMVMKKTGNDWKAEKSTSSPSQVELHVKRGQQDIAAAEPMDVLEISASVKKSGKVSLNAAGTNEMQLLLNGQPLETKRVDSNRTVVFSPITVLPSKGFQLGENTISVKYGGGNIPEELKSSSADKTLTVDKITPELKVISATSVSYDGQSHTPEYQWVRASDQAEIPQKLIPQEKDLEFAASTENGSFVDAVILPGKYQVSWKVLTFSRLVKRRNTYGKYGNYFSSTSTDCFLCDNR